MEKFKMTFKQAIEKYGDDAYANLCYDDDYQNKMIADYRIIRFCTSIADLVRATVTVTDEWIEVSLNSDDVEKYLYMTEDTNAFGQKFTLDLYGREEYIHDGFFF